MTFLEVLNKLKAIVELIQQYKEPVVTTIRSIQWIFTLMGLEKVNNVLNFILQYEPSVILGLLKVIEIVEQLPGIKGEQKFKKAVSMNEKPSMVQALVIGINSLIK